MYKESCFPLANFIFIFNTIKRLLIKRQRLYHLESEFWRLVVSGRIAVASSGWHRSHFRILCAHLRELLCSCRHVANWNTSTGLAAATHAMSQHRQCRNIRAAWHAEGREFNPRPEYCFVLHHESVIQKREPDAGLEPATSRLRACHSTDWVNRATSERKEWRYRDSSPGQADHNGLC